MMWCNEHGAVEPEAYTEYDIPDVNVGGYREEQINTCPNCHEVLLFGADHCKCGEWKGEEDEWCPNCIDMRNQTMGTAIHQIGLDTNLELSFKDAKDLLFSYFEEN